MTLSESKCSRSSGTLFGEELLVALSVYTEQTSAWNNRLEGKGCLRLRSESDDNGHRVDAMVNFPLGESAAVRALVFDTAQLDI